MALQPTRFDFRIALSNVDRARDANESVLVSRHPSETHTHAILRVLAWCLFHEEGLGFGPGLSSPDTADLWTRDATGELTTWIECGTATVEKLRNHQKHHSRLALHVLVDDPRAAEVLVRGLAETKLPKQSSPPGIWCVDAALVRDLAEREDRRQRWAVTVVGDHLYIDADGRSVDGAVVRHGEQA